MRNWCAASGGASRARQLCSRYLRAKGIGVSVVILTRKAGEGSPRKRNWKSHPVWLKQAPAALNTMCTKIAAACTPVMAATMWIAVQCKLRAIICERTPRRQRAARSRRRTAPAPAQAGARSRRRNSRATGTCCGGGACARTCRGRWKAACAQIPQAHGGGALVHRLPVHQPVRRRVQHVVCDEQQPERGGAIEQRERRAGTQHLRARLTLRSGCTRGRQSARG